MAASSRWTGISLRYSERVALPSGTSAGACSRTIPYRWKMISWEPDYARALAEAGLDIVFLQFDGTRDDIYRTLRGRDLLESPEIKKAYLGG